MEFGLLEIAIIAGVIVVGVIAVIIGIRCWWRRRDRRRLENSRHMKSTLEELHSKTKTVDQSEPVSPNRYQSIDNENTANQTNTKSGVDKTKTIEVYTPPTNGQNANISVASYSGGDNDDNDDNENEPEVAKYSQNNTTSSKNDQGSEVTIQMSVTNGTNRTNAATATSSVAGKTLTPTASENKYNIVIQEDDDDERDNIQNSKKKRNNRVKSAVTRSKENDTEGAKEDDRYRSKTDVRTAKNSTSTNINESFNKQKSDSPKTTKSKKDSLSISIDEQVRVSLPLSVEAPSKPSISTFSEVSEKEHSNANSSIPPPPSSSSFPPTSTTTEQKSTAEPAPKTINPTPAPALAPASPTEQSSPRGPNLVSKPSSTTLPTPSSPRTAAANFVVASSLMVKEVDSVLMSKDVAEVQKIYERSQRQLSGAPIPENDEEPVQKVGKTLKEAIAAAQKQATSYMDHLELQSKGSANRSNENPNRQYARALSTQHETKVSEERHQHPGKNTKSRRKKPNQKGMPPPPTQPPPEYVDGYDSDESMYAPQFANHMNNRSNRVFALDDSIIRDSQKDLQTTFEQLKSERGYGASKRRLQQQMQFGLPDKEGQLTEAEFYQKYWIEAGKLGEGSFARVRKITRKHDRKPFALKVIKKAGKSKEDLEALQKEIEILSKLNHKNVVRLTDWVDTKKRIHMVVEFCNGGDVFERIIKKKTFSEWEASHVIRQVAEALEHIHSKGIVHRDLKPDNLMYLDDSPKGEIKIIDFGLAGDCSKSPLKTPCGTAHYVAPEVLSTIPYNTQADMWSLGVIIYMLLCGFPPFFDATGNQKRLYQLIKSGKYRFPSPYWDHISDQAKDLIKGLLIKDPKERMSAPQVLSHPWIAGKAIRKEMDDLYMEQMQFFQSSRHFTNKKIGVEDKETEEKKHVNIFAKQQYAYNYE